ncbi:MAG: hypothetical protein K8Q89_01650 [Nitrosarchaeum sp.]|nr:hypothetical protein [Nitrosarchaeum sp.]
MNSTFAFFLLFSMLVTGLMINQSNFVFAEEPQGNSTTVTLDESMSAGDNPAKTGDVMQTGNATTTLDESMKTGEDLVKHEEPVPIVIPSPLKQIKDGVMSKDIVCKDGLELAFKLNGQAACVKATSVEKLVTRGWTQ